MENCLLKFLCFLSLYFYLYSIYLFIFFVCVICFSLLFHLRNCFFVWFWFAALIDFTILLWYLFASLCLENVPTLNRHFFVPILSLSFSILFQFYSSAIDYIIFMTKLPQVKLSMCQFHQNLKIKLLNTF